jgi:hypothetical protein
MMRRARCGVGRAACEERGTSILEVLIASAILVTLMAGLMSMAGIAISTTENQGHLAARTTEYAQDKMEQLLALAYGDAISDTRTFPAASTGGSGLSVGGSADPSAPVALYVDYLDANGNLLTSTGTTAPSGWFYKRVWKIADVSPGTCVLALSGTNSCLKQITVATTIARGFGGAMAASSVLVSLKTYPF